jgi:hypothetical protein
MRMAVTVEACAMRSMVVCTSRLRLSSIASWVALRMRAPQRSPSVSTNSLKPSSAERKLIAA